MTLHSHARHSLLAHIMAVLFLAASFATTDAVAQERPVAWTADDAELEWGPCPEFMPEGCQIAVLHGNPAEANTDVFFKMAPNTTAPRHYHSSVERMVLVSGEMHVTYDGHETVELRPGTYAFGPAELPHDAHCTDGEECVLYIAFELPVDAMAAGDQ